MSHLLIAAVHAAAARIDCLSSLALAISDTLDVSAEMFDPLENSRRASDLARIAFDQLQAVERSLTQAEESAAAVLAA